MSEGCKNVGCPRVAARRMCGLGHGSAPAGSPICHECGCLSCKLIALSTVDAAPVHGPSCVECGADLPMGAAYNACARCEAVHGKEGA